MTVRPALFGLIALLCAASCNGAAVGAGANPVCSASGTKHFAPPLTGEDACRRFTAGLAGTPDLAGIALEVLPQGVLNAVVTRTGDPSPRDFSLAVSDRPLRAEDLDILAADVRSGLR